MHISCSSFEFKHSKTKTYNEGVSLICIYMYNISSFLEVKCLDWVGKGESKEHWNSNYHNCNNTHKVISIPKITHQKIFHSLTRIKFFTNVSKLWSNHSIQGPRDRTSPIVPSPPDWHSLSQGKFSPF